MYCASFCDFLKVLFTRWNRLCISLCLFKLLEVLDRMCVCIIVYTFSDIIKRMQLGKNATVGLETDGITRQAILYANGQKSKHSICSVNLHDKEYSIEYHST